MTRPLYTSTQEERRAPGFVWFSERVNDCLRLPDIEALDALGKLVSEATADKESGYGPPQSDINAARRTWLDLYERTYVEQPT